jgi:hypothetical protein
MGGRALKSAYTRRYEKKEFLALKDEVVEILNKDFRWKTVPLYYREKETFGDLDVIIAWDKISDGQALRKYIEETFKPTEIYHTKNSNSWSFDYKECQVDFVMCKEEDFWCHYHYFSYNDLGNFIGALARNVGLKYGQEGLVYDHYFKGSKVGRVSVSKNYWEIFEFLDLSYKRFMMGFDNMEEVFEFVKTSKYFNSERYQLKNLNKINRERNLKRANYLAFIDYMEKNPKDEEFEYMEDKTSFIKLAKDFFPDFNYDLETRKMEFEVCKGLYAKAKFNGGILIKKYGIPPTKLPILIEHFKEMVHEEERMDYYDYLVSNELSEIYELFENVLSFYNANYELDN